MMILVNRGPRSLTHLRTPNLGILVGPRNGYRAESLKGWVWAADNDCFSGFDEERYRRMLDWAYVEATPAAGLPLWVTAPDAVADAAETLRLFSYWSGVIASLGLPVAFVAQDGLTMRTAPWSEFSCLFIGGSTEWKLGEDARLLVRYARRHGKQVHMGRVNTLRRIRYAKSIGCDSVDGTKYSRYADTYLPRDLAFAAGEGQMRLD